MEDYEVVVGGCKSSLSLIVAISGEKRNKEWKEESVEEINLSSVGVCRVRCRPDS